MTEPPVWNRLTAREWAARFPAKPPALRKIAYALRKLGAGHEPFTAPEWRIAKEAGVSVRTVRRYLGVFESYGVIEVKRWRYSSFVPLANTYRVFLAAVIPDDWSFNGGYFPISPRQTMSEKKQNNSAETGNSA